MALTALRVLFNSLVVVAVSLVAVSHSLSQAEEMRIGFNSECPVEKRAAPEALGAIAGSILLDVGKSIVGGAINALATHLTSEQAYLVESKSHMRSLLTKREDGTFTITRPEACIFAVIADGFEKPDVEAAKEHSFFPSATPTLVAASQIIYEKTGLASPPRFYVEGLLRLSPNDGSAFTFEPSYVYYPGFGKKNSWTHKPERDALFALEFFNPGEDKAFASFQIEWTSISSGSVEPSSISGKRLFWQLHGAEVPSSVGSFMPVNLKAMLTETAEPNTLAKHLGNALSKNRETIVSELETQIRHATSTSTRRAERAAHLEGADTRYTEYQQAYTTAETALKALEAATGDAQAPAAYATAVIAYRRLSAAEAIARAAWSTAQLGEFPALPPLKTLTSPSHAQKTLMKLSDKNEYLWANL